MAEPSNKRKENRLIGLSVLGFVLMNYPILAIFDMGQTWMGLPVLYLYFFVVWMLFIGLVAYLIEAKAR